MAGPGPLVTFRSLTVGYGRRPALSGLDGDIPEGASLALVGPNGAGKSSLLKAIVGECDILAGVLERHLPLREVAYLPQQAAIDRDFPISVGDFAGMGLWRRLGPWRGIDRDGQASVRDALETVGLMAQSGERIAALSGGQMQRALFARTLVQGARLILLDEPFAGLDASTTDDLLRVVTSWADEGRAVVAALHDADQVRIAFRDVLALAGRPLAWGAADVVLAGATLGRATSAPRPEASAVA